VEKLNLSQLIHRGNILVGYIGGWSTTRTFWFIVGIIIAVVGYSLYDNYQRELFIAKNERIIDSLNVEISVKKRENDELNEKAKQLDTELEEERNKVKTVINNFPQEKRPEIKDSDSAVGFIYKFMGKK